MWEFEEEAEEEEELPEELPETPKSSSARSEETGSEFEEEELWRRLQPV